jgi:hypothetical protein
MNRPQVGGADLEQQLFITGAADIERRSHSEHSVPKLHIGTDVTPDKTGHFGLHAGADCRRTNNPSAETMALS